MTLLPDAFVKIAAIAESVGAADIAESARVCIRRDRPEKLMVLHWSSTSPAPLCSWLEREVTPTAVESAAADSANIQWPAITADRVIALIPVGQFLDATQYEQLQQLVLARPSNTFRIVLTAAQTVNAETFTRSEAGLRHLLQPSNQCGSRFDDGSSERFLFWMETPDQTSLADRLERDRDSLLSWLKRPLPDDVRETLSKFQAWAMLECLDQKVPVPPEESRPERRRISRLTEQLRDCRRRVLEVLERGLANVERELTTSLNTLQQDLLLDVRKQLDKVSRKVKVDQVREDVIESIQTKLRDWDDKARKTLASRADELAKDTEVLLEGIDWQLVNELCASRGISEHYPRELEVLLQLPKESIPQPLVHPMEVVLPDDQATTKSVEKQSAKAIGLRYILDSISQIIVGIVDVVWKGKSGANTGQQSSGKDSLNQALQKVERSVAELAQEAVEAINRFTRDAASHWRRSFNDRFEKIERILSQASTNDGGENLASTQSQKQEIARLRDIIIERR
jgi:hypothetical protein